MHVRRMTDWNQHKRRGAMMVLIVVVLFMFIGMLAFSVDVAWMQLTRTELRIGTDAAARAAGEALSRAQDMSVARQAAKNIAQAHKVADQALLLSDQDIVPGNVTKQWDGTFSFTANGQPTNGIKVFGRRTKDSLSGPVRLFFGRLFNMHEFEPTHSAVVVRLDRDICLVVDRSSSMKLPVEGESSGSSINCNLAPPDSRWAALEEAIRVFNDTLALTIPVEHVALVSYASDYCRCDICNNASDIDQGLTGNLGLVGDAVDKISNRVFNGYTNIAAGIDNGVRVLTGPNARPFAAKTMIVMTDGHQNEGRAPELAAAEAALRGITVHAITFSEGADQDQMRKVAAAGNGNHYHADDQADLEAIYREIALSLPVIFTE